MSQVGRYQIVEKLGQGGMGSLYLARDPAIDRLVAIKLLRDDFDSQELRERFAREARSAGRLRHPNIVVVFDVGEHEGQPFIAMEYIPGETLSAIIKRGTSLAASRILLIVEDICSGLDYAHGAGIVHRDVKPANIMIDSSGVVKILDFGIAHVAESGMTKSGSVVGTLNYMAPEQVLGRPIDRRCDVFAVGAVLYELLTLRQAFPGGLQEGILKRIVHDEPAPLSDSLPDLDPALERVVKKSLEKDPALRYADLSQMQKDLAAFRTGIPETVRPGADAVTQSLVGPRPTERTSSGRRDTERRVLEKRRATEIEEQLYAAEAAFEAGNYHGAVAACERAAILNPDDERALDLRARARTELHEAGILQLVGEARVRLHEGALTAAGDLLDRAAANQVALPADSPAAASLERAQSDLEKARERTELVRKTMKRATAALERQEFESAIRSANEALGLDPVLTEALHVRRLAQDAIEQPHRPHDPPTAPRATGGPTPMAAWQPYLGVAPTPVEPELEARHAFGHWRTTIAVGLVVAAAAGAAFALWPWPSQAPLNVAIPDAPNGAAPVLVTSPPPIERDVETSAVPEERQPMISASAADQPGPAVAAPVVSTPAGPPPRAANRPPVPVNPRTFGVPPPTAIDEAAIRQTLQRYEQALASLDPAAVRAVYPSVDTRGLASQFATYSSFKNEIQVARIRIGANRQTAIATGFVTSAPVLKAGGPEMTQRRPMTFLFWKAGDSWLIEETRSPGRDK
ncbi:MAG: protein kinase [Vicinamibacterales bacterium]